MTETNQYNGGSEESTNQEIFPLSSVYTQNFPYILAQSGISLVVSTFQAGKVILISAENGLIDIQFREFNKPMGIALNNGQLSIGGQNTVWHYRNMPAYAPILEPEGKKDGSYIPQHIHITDDIDIHEMAWGQDGLWVVNTKCGTLCTLDQDHGFTPHWRPHFISSLNPEDRCHLNGLAVVNGYPKYVTALGETDTAGGWRDNKRDGGILMDVATNQILARGLSMPHSPRLYNGKLWVLESGNGGLGWYDPDAINSGRYVSQSIETVTHLPGFTRGLDFAGSLAFIGLSQVRESAVFSGIPLVDRVENRKCGVWVVNIHTGETIAFLRFEGEVQEIFAVQVLSTRFPELLSWDDARITQPSGLHGAHVLYEPVVLR